MYTYATDVVDGGYGGKKGQEEKTLAHSFGCYVKVQQ